MIYSVYSQSEGSIFLPRSPGAAVDFLNIEPPVCIQGGRGMKYGSRVAANKIKLHCTVGINFPVNEGLEREQR